MADKMQFDLVSPERGLASMEAKEVQLPGAEGDMTALPDHAPLVTTLRPGVLRVSDGQSDREFVVTGGFAEITAESISVLAEQAMPKDEINGDVFAKMVDVANEKLAKAQAQSANHPASVDDAAKYLDDIIAMGGEIGLSANR
ncbi:MAG: F0F1 ATP synthase subunit epsilon [Roseovarius sp.]|nr:F0F1 ATP synthase subunit epsilon [Roseovarius sp.]